MCLSGRVRPSHTIDFELIGTNIVIPVKVNSSTTLRLIFDTGVRHTIITELFSEDSLNLNYLREVPLTGLGDGEPLITYLSTQNRLSCETFVIDSVTVYALKENIFQLTRHLGSKVNGMIGYDLVRDYTIRIDYSRKKIYFYEPDTYSPDKKFRSVPVTIENNKPYIRAKVNLGGTEHEVKLLVDTGAELPLWLVNTNFKHYSIPEKSVYTFIGQGLNGEIFGSVARINSSTIGGYTFKNPIVAFPDSSAISIIISSNERDGTVGSEILKRFDIVLNYKDTTMYVKRNSHFRQEFTYNTTGIEVVQPYQDLPFYEVAELWEKSPAAQAGLKVGDKIESIDYLPVGDLSLMRIKEMLRKENGTVRLVITREEGAEILRKKIKFKSYKL